MAKGYWLVRVDVTDPDAYELYRGANGPPMAVFGARFMVRGGRQEVVEGNGRTRNVVVEFPSYDDALACWRSGGYQEVLRLRNAAAISDLVVIEGYDGPQPTADG